MISSGSKRGIARFAQEFNIVQLHFHLSNSLPIIVDVGVHRCRTGGIYLAALPQILGAHLAKPVPGCDPHKECLFVLPKSIVCCHSKVRYLGLTVATLVLNRFRWPKSRSSTQTWTGILAALVLFSAIAGILSVL